jgi:hypothetical protein
VTEREGRDEREDTGETEVGAEAGVDEGEGELEVISVSVPTVRGGEEGVLLSTGSDCTFHCCAEISRARRTSLDGGSMDPTRSEETKRVTECVCVCVCV